MQIILTHENADFDAIASLLAAHRLYPGALPLLPHRVNRNVMAFLSLYGPGLPFLQQDELPRARAVQRVILVDTAKLTPVRGVDPVDAQVLVIDHHPTPEVSQPAWQFQVEALGATTTLLTEAISTRLVPISPAEATLMLAGIYEDTGNLTYASTTPRDLRAAAWLIDQGADLEIANEFLEHPLTPAQQAIYESLGAHMETLVIGGHPVILSWAVSPPDTEEEISTLAHKLRNLLEPSALFILVQIGGNVQMVARSATDDINVAAVAERFGGGGHDRAAAALIRNQSAFGLANELRDLLPGFVQPRVKVRDLMSHGVRTVAPDEPVEQVAKQMLQTGHEGFPVVDSANQVVGLITRNAVDRATQHRLQGHAVRRVMQPGSVTVSPDDSVEHVRALMIQTGWGQIPVTQDGSLIGVVTRTDMIRLYATPRNAERQRIAHLMEQAIAAPLLSLIRRIGAEAAETGSVIYFVGGLVRDLLLGQDIVDVDLVVEGDAIDLARTMSELYGGDVRSHARFGTAKWLLPDDIWEAVGRDTHRADRPDAERQGRSGRGTLPSFIDMVTARTEFYEHPTALPMVARSSIKQDLHRRDFTINTLAIRLDPQQWGEMLDFYGGRADLESGIIRVLHSLSFVDDPTRILRAARFEARLGFRIDERSAALISEAIPLLGRISGERIRHELDLIFQEARPEDALDRLESLDVLREICPGLVSDTWLAERFAKLRESFDGNLWDIDLSTTRHVLYWALFTHRLEEGMFEFLRQQLRLPSHLAELHAEQASLREMLALLAPTESPGEIAVRLDCFALESLALAWLTTDDPGLQDRLTTYARTWRHVEAHLDGDDLKRLGFRPGPLFREILQGLRVARLNGALRTRDEEIAWVTTRFTPDATRSTASTEAR
ncbi:MAG: CBS domain-containing protein [Anaerolineae bacterium]|jgi:tRNA nucleotidyltransferase (CCA-adding enzyme)|nr:CBS domain-containing protein [Anaerolineae bacterium]